MESKKEKFIGTGTECRVFDMRNGRVRKRYFDGEAADIAYNNARKAAQHGLGPKVFYKIKSGYVTEKAQRPGHVSRKKLNELCEKLNEIFWPDFAQDIRGCSGAMIFKCNLGRIKGKLVAIDFGPISSGEITEW